jgi:SNF2 family DNA or RNA helicase
MQLPNGITPYDHQLDGAREALQQRRSINAFDVGLGKTLTSMIAMMEYQKHTGGKALVVCPPSLITNWQREARGLLELDVRSAGKVPLPDDINGRYFLVADEAHYYQNITSQRTQRMIQLASGADGCLLMTATPIRNYPANIFPLLKIINHPLGSNFEAFKRNFCGGKYSGSTNLLQLHGEIQASLTLGSKDDFLDLPSFTRKMIKVDFDGAAQIIFNAAFHEMRNLYRERVRSGEVSSKGFYIVLLNHLRQAAALGKTFRAARITKKALEAGHQVVVFTNFVKAARYLERHLHEAGVSTLIGSVPKARRQKLIDDFQDGVNHVFAMTRAGSAGINLQEGTVFISVDRTWSPFDMIQAEGRIHRNGQDEPCYSLWLQDSIIDPFLDRMMLRKYKTARMVLYGTADTMEGVGDPGVWAETLSNFLFGYM